MPAFLGTAIISISLALVFYSIGTWAERIQRTLKLWHIIFFLFGLCADTLGTALMSQIASANVGNTDPLHAVTGPYRPFGRIGKATRKRRKISADSACSFGLSG